MLWVFLLLSCVALDARLCVHDQKGWCQGHEIWGWCFHNKTSGEFNCDDANFCVGQETLKNKKNAGCFSRDNHTVCCCNDADGCNLGFIPVAPKYAAGQACYNSVEEPNEDPKFFKTCDDPWCFAFLSADAEGGLTTVTRGCHSRKLVMHNIWLSEDKKFQNNTKWQATESLAAQPSCDDITWDSGSVNGTESQCFDFNFEEDGVDKKGRLCCCRGTHKCNEKFMWGDPGIDMADLELIRAVRNAPVASAPAFLSTVSTIFSFIALFLFRY